ncbi:hypothetical protein CsSME_00038184 [Camellia sinensis var. sinensis]
MGWNIYTLLMHTTKRDLQRPKRSWMPSFQTIHLQMSRFSYLGTRLTYPMLPQRMS